MTPPALPADPLPAQLHDLAGLLVLALRQFRGLLAGIVPGPTGGAPWTDLRGLLVSSPPPPPPPPPQAAAPSLPAVSFKAPPPPAFPELAPVQPGDPAPSLPAPAFLPAVPAAPVVPAVATPAPQAPPPAAADVPAPQAPAGVPSAAARQEEVPPAAPPAGQFLSLPTLPLPWTSPVVPPAELGEHGPGAQGPNPPPFSARGPGTPPAPAFSAPFGGAPFPAPDLPASTPPALGPAGGEVPAFSPPGEGPWPRLAGEGPPGSAEPFALAPPLPAAGAGVEGHDLARIAEGVERLVDLVSDLAEQGAEVGAGAPPASGSWSGAGGFSVPDDAFTPSSPSVDLFQLFRPGKQADAAAHPGGVRGRRRAHMENQE